THDTCSGRARTLALTSRGPERGVTQQEKRLPVRRRPGRIHRPTRTERQHTMKLPKKGTQPPRAPPGRRSRRRAPKALLAALSVSTASVAVPALTAAPAFAAPEPTGAPTTYT